MKEELKFKDTMARHYAFANNSITLGAVMLDNMAKTRLLVKRTEDEKLEIHRRHR